MTAPPRRPPLLRDLHAPQLADLFLVAAISTVLAIRFALHVSGYPSMGGARLHIAHMLWGGLLMLAALIVLLGFLGRRPRRVAAFIGGVGFGTFIDEIGKFVTRDNDYFYRPAVALIYVTIVLLYLAMRTLHSRRPVSREELLANALQEVEQAVVRDLDRDERDRALRWLDLAGRDDAVSRALAPLLLDSPLVPTRRPGPITRARRALVARYEQIAAHPKFTTGVIVFFVTQLVLKLVQVLVLTAAHPGVNGPFHGPLWTVGADRYATADRLQLASSLLSAAFVLRGVVAIRHSRYEGLRWFQRSILTSVFLTQVFMFYREQWGGLVNLAFNLVVLVTLNFILARERGRRDPQVDRFTG